MGGVLQSKIAKKEARCAKTPLKVGGLLVGGGETHKGFPVAWVQAST